MSTNLAGTANDNTDSFTYNPAGQIASRTRSNAGYSFASHINVDTLFNHNGLNQITSVTGSAAPTYDARGNMTSDGAVSFGYDQYNRLTSAGSATFDYDPLGRLYQSTGASGTARRQYDGADMIAVYNSAGSLTERYVHGPGMDEPLVMYTGSGTSNRTFFHADARGSIIAHTNSSGYRTAVLAYDEYGNPASTNPGRYQYTGQTWLSDAGLYHYKNRAYNPRLMRFMQADPIGHSGGINLYAYVGGG
ncbi:MAG: RHS repeat-associated core domain-containing protein [Oceanicaulis sp.]